MNEHRRRMAAQKSGNSQGRTSNADSATHQGFLARLLSPKNSAREDLTKSLEDPFRRPDHFGWLRHWWDESPHSVAAASVLVLLLLLITLTAHGLGGGGNPGPPTVGVEQIVLGTGQEDLTDLDTTLDGTVVRTDSAPAPNAPDEIVGPNIPDTPIGNLPSPVTSGGGASVAGPLMQFESELACLRVPMPKGGSGGLGKLDGIFDIPSSVNSVVYVIDKSSSMGSASRLHRVKAELIHGINNLAEDQRFSIVFFDSTAWPLYSQQGGAATGMSGRPTLLQATKANKDQATLWVQQMSPGGGTNPYPAVMAALGVNPELVMLLSDGEFNPAYVDQITHENQQKGTKKAKIDCIGLAENIQTLQDAAGRNGGVYYEAR